MGAQAPGAQGRSNRHESFAKLGNGSSAPSRRLSGERATSMSVRFRKISEASIDETRVTLRVIAAGNLVLGRVSTLAFVEDGVEMMSTEGADPPILEALALAKRLASFKEQDVDVVDPDRLWQADWSALDDG